ncbi:hypothetical protein Bbelb_387400 [Branchiostoma belcheri]|nr:hypothetical protein Bbelb_387400 [Branchiostoma belcheri]
MPGEETVQTGLVRLKGGQVTRLRAHLSYWSGETSGFKSTAKPITQSTEEDQSDWLKALAKLDALIPTGTLSKEYLVSAMMDRMYWRERSRVWDQEPPQTL